LLIEEFKIIFLKKSIISYIIYMTKYRKRKQRTYKRIQRGGIWPFTESDPTAPSLGSKASSWFQSKKSGAESSWGSLFGSTPPTTTDTTSSSTYTSSTPSTIDTTTTSSTYIPTTPQTQTQTDISPSQSTYTSAVGGRKRRRMRGGKGGLGLTYYATPVSGLKVVEPNEWLLYNNGANQKGGSRKRRCKTKKRRCKTKTRRCKTKKR